MRIFILPLLSLIFDVFAGSSDLLTSSCCNLATGSCRSICEEISLVSLAINDDERWRYLGRLTSFCSRKLVPFWSCLNDTLQEVDKGQSFFGRSCCGLPMSQTCALVCLQARTKDDLSPACRPSDETTFYACLEQQKAGQLCCEESKSSECHSACKELFASVGAPSKEMKSYVSSACSQESSHVLQCMRNFSHTSTSDIPSKSLHCCDKSSDTDCRIACRNILKTQTVGQEIVDNLIAAGCGMPMPHDKLWQCFLASADSMETEPSSASQLDNLGMDSAKLQCCFKATSVTCQRLCLKTFGNEWEKTWEDFDQQCQYQPAESNMLQCLAEVEEPCELGCEGLSYCTNFNNRPVELFRNCNKQSDQAARYDVELWKKGVIHMPMVDIPVLDITTCQPHVWKTIACALQIKPCHTKAHVNMICKSDCLNILSECIDESRLLKGQTAETLCNVLSPHAEDLPCISLKSYFGEVKHVNAPIDVTHPCKSSTCKVSEVCLTNRSCLSTDCLPHQCGPGCRLGAMSQLVVPAKTHVLVPRVYHGKHCHKVCYCNSDGILETCVAMPCLSKGRCLVQGQEIAHGSKYMMNCTVCICYAGELRCASMCTDNPHQNVDHLTGNFCNCAGHYVPVCGSNGRTYPSACVARCAGLKNGQYISGSCAENDPCIDNPCGSKKRCLPKRQVCFSLKRKCPQHVCVNGNVSCHRLPPLPVCDTDHKEHFNPCTLLQNGKQLLYYGECKHNCLRTGQVCGYNGQTYSSECAAQVDRVFIDYRQACIHNFAHIQVSSGMSQCIDVQCPPSPSPHCHGPVPPGSCCPVCGSVLKLVYSQKLLDRALEAVNNAHLPLISTFTKRLQEHIKTIECEVSTYLSTDSTIIAIIQTNSAHPSAQQVEACIREAEKLQALLDQGSPTLLMELPLSSLIGGFFIQPERLVINGGSCTVSSIALKILLFLIALKLYLIS